MEIDNSAASAFRTCPLKYYESYVRGLDLKPFPGTVTPLRLGSRVHELLEEYYCELAESPRVPYPASENPALELEAEIIMAGYRAKYPQEDFEIVDIERTIKVALPRYCKWCYLQAQGNEILCDNCHEMLPINCHIYTGKIDLTFRLNGVLNIMDHKTQNRRATSNHPKKWAAKDQASLYLWAAERIYKEHVDRFHVNVLIRPSEKLQEGPIFPDRQILERTEDQLKIAVRDIAFVADEIERYKQMFGEDLWPSNREACSAGYFDCEYYQPHTYGWSDAIMEEKYQPKEEYLHLGGIPIIQ